MSAKTKPPEADMTTPTPEAERRNADLLHQAKRLADDAEKYLKAMHKDRFDPDSYYSIRVETAIEAVRRALDAQAHAVDLGPCRCGGVAEAKCNGVYWYVECSKCPAALDGAFSGPKGRGDAIAAWNRRAALGASERDAVIVWIGVDGLGVAHPHTVAADEELCRALCSLQEEGEVILVPRSGALTVRALKGRA